jgi:hypothetical protein
MFYNNQSIYERQDYEASLKIIGSLSNLFSDAKEPYLHYRIAEKVFCNAFLSKDLSRGDVALDAYKGKLGIGLKTFLENNNKSFQKIAEFNKDRTLYADKSPKEIVEIVSNLRNKRIEFTEKLYGLDTSIYHCVVRAKNIFKIHEESMKYIDILNIRDIKETKSSIKFNDGVHDYSFNLSKSTLTKRFITTNTLYEFDVQILNNPLDDIKDCFSKQDFLYATKDKIIDTIYLPLYGKSKIVYERSGLNQWNASGRERNINEVYIPIPSAVHKKSPNFFPSRDEPFNLILPNGKELQSKVCQSGDKALMSYSNRALGEWILREVLSLKEGELLTYDKLQILGVDSVRIDKIDTQNYEINFTQLGSFESYIKEEG